MFLLYYLTSLMTNFFFSVLNNLGQITQNVQRQTSTELTVTS